MKILTDVHTHTAFSPDGREEMSSMLQRARQIDLRYWGVSEHFDYDYLVDSIINPDAPDVPVTYTDAESYFSTARALQAESADLYLLVGGEFGFTRNKAAVPLYHALIERYKPDFIVNSVHTQGKHDYYRKEAFEGKDKHTAYAGYLSLVRDSLDAGYPYDIVGHIGYCSRWAPYEDKALRYEEFPLELDDILRTIIEKNKILEVNSSVKGLDVPFLPAPAIVARYFALGGRNVSFASDAHAGDRLADGRETAVETLRGIGFTFLTVPCRGKYIKVEL